MDITKFVLSRRNDGLVAGDYGSYRKQLSRRVLTVQRKLGRTAAKGRKYVSKAPITGKDIAGNPEFVHLLLLTAERAWAHSMYMKSLHAAESSSKAVAGSRRKHIISRLHKAEQIAAGLLGLLKETSDATVWSQDVFEARAYFCTLHGSRHFESQKWEKCLKAYSEAHLIYTSLAKSSATKYREHFHELLSSTVDPSIRYAAYQLQLPRTLPIPKIAARYLPRDSDTVGQLHHGDTASADQSMSAMSTDLDGAVEDLPKSITWRSRTVNLEDANIAQALAAVSVAELKLTEQLSLARALLSAEKASAYDDILSKSQDAVDATKKAIDELTADSVTQDDQRMQALQVTSTAVNYALVGWRIGRNRTLCGKADGAYLEFEARRKSGRRTITPSHERKPKILAGLRERVVLYETTLQSLELVKQLPGVAADQPLQEELASQRSYFTSLRCLAIAHSHALAGDTKNALALFARAADYLSSAQHAVSTPTEGESKPLNIHVTLPQIETLQHLLRGLVFRYRGLVELDHLRSDAAKSAKATSAGNLPLIERLDEYPVGGADLTNLVIYPPRIRPIPVKPLFFDVAWNYIEYPGRGKRATEAPASAGSEGPKETVEAKKEGRKGWFGFGRSAQ